MKHTCHSKGCPNNYINTQCTPAHANDYKGAECHPVIDCPKHLAPVVTIQKCCGRFWGKSKFSIHHVPYLFDWREIWASCWPWQLLHTRKSTLRCSRRMRTCVILLKKLCLFPIDEMTVRGVTNQWNVAGIGYYTMQKHQMWPRVVTGSPHTMKPEVEPVCPRRIHSGRWGLSSLRRTRVRPSLTYRQNLLPSMKTTERHSIFQSTLWRLSSSAWRYRGASGSLARYARDLSQAWSDGSQWSLVTQQVQHVSGILPWMLLGWPPLLYHQNFCTVGKYAI